MINHRIPIAMVKDTSLVHEPLRGCRRDGHRPSLDHGSHQALVAVLSQALPACHAKFGSVHATREHMCARRCLSLSRQQLGCRALAFAQEFRIWLLALLSQTIV